MNVLITLRLDSDTEVDVLPGIDTRFPSTSHVDVAVGDPGRSLRLSAFLGESDRMRRIAKAAEEAADLLAAAESETPRTPADPTAAVCRLHGPACTRDPYQTHQLISPAAAAVRAAAAEGRLLLGWERTADIPQGPDSREARVYLRTHRGEPAVLVLDHDARYALASLLDAHVDTGAPCATAGCGTPVDELDASDPSLWGWVRVHVAGTDLTERWWCSPWCTQRAIADAGAGLSGDDELDARYGPGASDEHAAIQAEVVEAGFEAEQLYDGSVQAGDPR